MELHADYKMDWQFVNRGSERLFAEVWEACEHAVKEIEEFYPSFETNMLMSKACHYQTEPVWNKRQAKRRIEFITNWANEMKSNYEKF